jgi:threonine dehydratase
VNETEIAHAMVYALKQEKIVVEGGGAVALAALLAGKLDVRGKRVACVVSGGNVDMEMLLGLLSAEKAGGRE